MGCISACFGHCSNRYKKIGKHEVVVQKIESTKEAQIATDHLKVVEERVDNNEDQLNSSARKCIGFDDLNLIVHEEEAASVSQIEECANLVGAGEKAEGDEGKKEAKEILNSSKEEEETGKGEMKLGNQGRDDEIVSDSSESSLFTYPTHNRYKNCADSDDECEVVVSSYKVKETHTGTGRSPVIEEESSESLFSLSLDSKRQSSTPGIEGDKEVSSSTFITRSFDSVLNSIENLCQCKVVRIKVTPSSTMKKNQEQEKVMELSGRISNSCRNGVNVIGVDTSLSSWLVESENDPGQENNNPSGSVGNSSLKDRAILGGLTMDELKQMSRHSSPRRGSPMLNPDETPILGTVGSYWRHTGGCSQLPV